MEFESQTRTINLNLRTSPPIHAESGFRLPMRDISSLSLHVKMGWKSVQKVLGLVISTIDDIEKNV